MHKDKCVGGRGGNLYYDICQVPHAHNHTCQTEDYNSLVKHIVSSACVGRVGHLGRNSLGLALFYRIIVHGRKPACGQGARACVFPLCLRI